MASGTGYIVSWQNNAVGGFIHVCAGDELVGDDVAFPFSECSPQLQAILKSKSISENGDCPPPAGSLRVQFDFDIVNNGDLAINVRL